MVTLMKTATIQFRPTFKDKRGNLQQLATLVVQAGQAGAQLICAPELATTGYSFMNEAEVAPLAEVIGPGNMTFDIFKALAKKLNAYIVWGMVERDAGSGDLYNAQVCMAPDGSWASFRKINKWGNDWLWAKAGRSNPPIIEMHLGGETRPTGLPNSSEVIDKKLGMLICRDIRDKKDSKWSDFYEKGDADIVCLSANWGDGGFPAVSWMDFAKDNNAILVVSNRWGKEIPNDFGEGGVCVIWPDGRVVCDGLVWNADCIVFAEV